MALNVKVGLIGKLDMLKFKNMGKTREKAIQSAPASKITGSFPINENANNLHPNYMTLVIKEIVSHENARAKTYIFQRANGETFPYFRAGQYISLKLSLEGSFVTRAYSISSSPKDALKGIMSITIRTNPNGFVADKLLDNLKVGDRIISSDPQGQFYYEDLRDAKTVVGLAGGSGITPFLSMAYAIRDGVEDFNLTLLFGSRDRENILFEDELSEIAKACSKVKVIHVLSEEVVDGYEHGFITAELIKKYAPQDEEYSVYFCGPDAMCKFLEPEIKKLELPQRLYRRKLMDVTKSPWEFDEYPSECKDAIFDLTVRQGAEEYKLKANANEPVLVAIERGGIKAPSRCRSGECGWCRSKLISGTVFIPPENEQRRWADVEYGYIHPCCSFATSDLILEVPEIGRASCRERV